MISLSQAFAQWQELAASIPQDDTVMLSESWNDYTDSLCKGGEFCDLQYHYAPAYDEPMPGPGSRYDALSDDREFILGAMGVRMKVSRLQSRKDGGDWPACSSHWRASIIRGKKRLTCEYSMGSAHKGEPELPSVLWSLMQDADGTDGETFASWCANYGYSDDSIKARATFEACKRNGAALRRVFTAAELDSLRELFADF